MDDNYCVYIHTNRFNGKRYVGITKQDPKRRWSNGRGYVGCPYFYNSICKHGWEGFLHEVIEDCLSQYEAEDKERNYINLYKTTDSRYGYNIREGFFWNGDTYKKLSRKEWCSKSLRAIDQYDIHHNFIRTWAGASEVQSQLGICLYSINKCCICGKPNVVGGYYWAYHGREPFWCVDIDSKPVAKISAKDNSVLAVFPSTGEAAKRECAHQSSISSECSGKLRPKGNFVWRFLNAYSVGGHVIDKTNFFEITTQNALPYVITTKDLELCQTDAIDQFDVHHNYVSTWSNVVSIQNKFGISGTTILSCCKIGKPVTAGGFYWSFRNTEPIWGIDSKNTPVAKLDISNNRVIDTFYSCKEAERRTGFGHSSITKQCKGESQSRGKYIWRYIDAYSVAGHIIDKQTFQEVGIAEAANLLILPENINKQNE